MPPAPGNPAVMQKRRHEAAVEIGKLTDLIEGVEKTLAFLKHRRKKAMARFNAYGGLQNVAPRSLG